MIRQWSLCVTGVLLGLNAAGVLAQFAARVPVTPLAPGTLPGTAERCLELSQLELPELLMIDAQARVAGLFELPGGPTAAATAIDLSTFCRVSGVILPEIRFEVWLPEAPA
jgi:hypothetical protein